MSVLVNVLAGYGVVALGVALIIQLQFALDDDLHNDVEPLDVLACSAISCILGAAWIILLAIYIHDKRRPA